MSIGILRDSNKKKDMSDTAAIVVGASLGTSPVTILLQFSMGICEGGRTGMTAVIVSLGFALSFFFTPLLSSIGPVSVGSPLFLFGVMMKKSTVDVQWDDMKAFIAIIILMTFTFSIASGLIGGIGAYIAFHVWNWIVLGCNTARSKVFAGNERPALDNLPIENEEDAPHSAIPQPQVDDEISYRLCGLSSPTLPKVSISLSSIVIKAFSFQTIEQ